MGSTGAPAVGVEPNRVEQSAIPVFQRHSLSTVDGIDTELGRLALVLLLGGASPGHYGVRDTADGILPLIEPLPSGRSQRAAIAARDEEASIGTTVTELLRSSRTRGSWSRTTPPARRAARTPPSGGAKVVRLPRRGKGQALTLGERAAPAGALLLCDADLRGELTEACRRHGRQPPIAAFDRHVGGGFGLAKGAARALIRLATGRETREPLSGQRHLTAAAREACFPLVAGFGCEVGMTVDAVRAGLDIHEVELALEHRATGRDLGGFVHRGRQLRDILLAFGPQARNHRGLRLPLVGWIVGCAEPELLPVAAIGLADDLWAGEERGFRAHLLVRLHRQAS